MAINDKHIDDLIAKYLAGEVSQEEDLQLRHWMDESAENKKYFGDIQFVHDKAVASHKYIRVDAEKAWTKVKGQMTHGKTSAPDHKTKIISIQKWDWMRVAAIFILVIGCAAIIYKLTKKQAPETNIAYTISSKNSTLSHTFTGSTNVFLNKNTSLTIKQNRKERQKELTLSGEAFIQHKHSTDTALLVKANETLIRDIGTSFNVKAYPENSTIEVYVAEGEVAFYTDKLPGIVLNKGETGIYDKASQTFTKKSVVNQNTIAYKTRKFVFMGTRLIDALEELNTVYPEPITLKNPNLANCSITVTFDNESITSIVDILAETLGLKFVKTGHGYILDGTQCSSK